jgi:hypothetical protein
MDSSTGLWIFLSLLAAVIAVVVFLFIKAKKNEKAVMITSDFYKALIALNGQTRLTYSIKTNFEEVYYRKTRQSCYVFNYEKAFRSFCTSSTYLEPFQNAFDLKRNETVYGFYLDAIKQLREMYPFSQEAASKTKLSPQKYQEIEKKLVEKHRLKMPVFPEFKIRIRVSYTSPGGRSTYNAWNDYSLDDFLVLCPQKISMSGVLPPKLDKADTQSSSAQTKGMTPKSVDFSQNVVAQAAGKQEGTEKARKAYSSKIGTPVPAKTASAESDSFPNQADPISNTVAATPDGIFLYVGGRISFRNTRTGTLCPFQQVRKKDLSFLDASLAEILLSKIKENQGLPLTTEQMVQTINEKIGPSAVETDYIREAFADSGDCLTEKEAIAFLNHAQPNAEWGRDLVPFSNIGEDAETAFSSFYSAILRRDDRNPHLRMLFLRFFVSLSLNQTQGKYIVFPSFSIDEYLLQILRQETADFSAFLQPARLYSSVIKYCSNATSENFKNALSCLDKRLSVDVLNSFEPFAAFYTSAGGKLFKTNSDFLLEINHYSGQLNKIICSKLASFEREIPGIVEFRRAEFFQFLGNLRLSTIPSFENMMKEEFDSRLPFSLSSFCVCPSDAKKASEILEMDDDGFSRLLEMEGFRFSEKDQLFYSNGRTNYADALYDEIARNSTEDYRYDNPNNSRLYNNAIKSLEQRLLLFPAGSGIFHTRFYFEKRGLSGESIDILGFKIEKFLKGKNVFSISQLQSAFSGDKSFEFFLAAHESVADVY